MKSVPAYGEQRSITNNSLHQFMDLKKAQWGGTALTLGNAPGDSFTFTSANLQGLNG